jgi:hypothetical protein
MPDCRLTSACAAGLLLLAPAAARSDEVTSLAVSTGQYGMRKEIPHSMGLELQVRTPWRWHVIRPVAGILTSSQGAAFVYSGVAFELDLPAGVRLTPGFAPGVVLSKGEGDLGSLVDFRSSLELSIAAWQRLRIGVAFSHISNGRLGERNPGVEVLEVGISFPRN